jgi:hypothetical protein
LIDGTFDAKDICVGRKGTGRGGQRRWIRIGKRSHPVNELVSLKHFLI